MELLQLSTRYRLAAAPDRRVAKLVVTVVNRYGSRELLWGRLHGYRSLYWCNPKGFGRELRAGMYRRGKHLPGVHFEMSTPFASNTVVIVGSPSGLAVINITNYAISYEWADEFEVIEHHGNLWEMRRRRVVSATEADRRMDLVQSGYYMTPTVRRFLGLMR